MYCVRAFASLCVKLHEATFVSESEIAHGIARKSLKNMSTNTWLDRSVNVQLRILKIEQDRLRDAVFWGVGISLTRGSNCGRL